MRSHESFNVLLCILCGISHSHSSVQPKIFRSHFFLAPPKIQLRICSIVLLTLYRYDTLFAMENTKATNQDMSFSETHTTHTLFGIVIFQHPKFAIRFATPRHPINIYMYIGTFCRLCCFSYTTCLLNKNKSLYILLFIPQSKKEGRLR